MSKCNPHPLAPHGFMRNASHDAGEYVCECEGWSPKEADHLIAAAPDLLAALEEFVEGLDEDCGGAFCDECLPYRNARRAIAKAKGERP